MFYLIAKIPLIMKPKLFFWIDTSGVHYGLAKYIQDNFDCELFSIFEMTDKPKLFFESQKLVKFKKIWFYHDYILKTKRKPDLNYLKSIEKKYNIPLWVIAANDRIFNHFNNFYKFSRDEILLILEDGIKLFERVLDEVKPDFLVMFETHQQHNHLFYKICKARNIKILMTIPSRTPVTKDHLPNENMYYLADEHDKFLPLPKTIKPNIYEKIKLNKKFENIRDSNYDKIVYGGFLTSRSKYFKAVLKYLFTNDTNVQTHYTYFGRSKIKVIFDRIAYELRKKYRKNFMEKNLSKNIENDSPFIYFPLHQEQERILLLGAPFYTNQFDVIQNIAKSLPMGYNLYVKEHFMMNVRGWRSVSEMKKIMSLYNVKLLHHTVNSEELIRKSSLVISIKGTTAIEAVIHNKPSIIFENVGPYQLSSVHKLQSITELPQAIRKSLKIKVNPDEVRKYLDAINEHAFQFPYVRMYIDFESEFKIGGYYANTEIDSHKIMEYLEKFEPELTKLALFHIENIKRLSN